MGKKKVEWKPDINIVMIMRKGQNYKPNKKDRKRLDKIFIE